jgi:hypothetical protein
LGGKCTLTAVYWEARYSLRDPAWITQAMLVVAGFAEVRLGDGAWPSSLRHSRLVHALDHPLALAQENRVVALCANAVALYGEFGIERQPGLDLGPRFFEPAKQRQS